MRKKYKDFADDQEHEWIHFMSYCLLKPNLIISSAKGGLNFEESYSALYPHYLEEKKKVWKYIQSVESKCRWAVDKINEKVLKERNEN